MLGLTFPFVPESKADLESRRFDVAGAVTVTSSLAILVYAISKAPDVGWGSARTIVLLIVAAALSAAFALIETRTTGPLVPFSIFRIRTLLAANIVGFLLGAVIFANFFVLTLYVQQVLGWSALKTGLTFLATGRARPSSGPVSPRRSRRRSARGWLSSSGCSSWPRRWPGTRRSR